MSGDGKLTQAEYHAMQAATADRNRRALAAEDEAMEPKEHDPAAFAEGDKLSALIGEANSKRFDPRLPEPWTLDDIADERDLARANDWKLAQRWPWVDAVAWIALAGPEVMPVLSACRSMFARQEGAAPATVERKCWSVLQTCVDRLSLGDAERVLRGWCRAGLMPVDGSGTPIRLPDHGPAFEAMLSAAEIQRLAPATRAAVVEPAEPVAPRAEREAEGVRVAGLLDQEGFSLRDVRKRDVADRWDASKGRPLAVTTITGWMDGKPKSGRPKSV